MVFNLMDGATSGDLAWNEVQSISPRFWLMERFMYLLLRALDDGVAMQVLLKKLSDADRLELERTIAEWREPLDRQYIWNKLSEEEKQKANDELAAYTAKKYAEALFRELKP